MALLVKEGFGQIEPNHLSGQRNGQIYAQLPCNPEIKVLQNAQFVKYAYADGEVNYTGAGEWMLVYNEVKLYDPKHSYKDFKYDVKDFFDGKLFPRVFKTMPGDIFTTNLIEMGTKTASTIAVKDKLTVNADGILEITADVTGSDFVWQIVKVYTMADGQPAVKIQRIV